MISGSLKMKVAASIVAISSIHLLKVFMDATNSDHSKLICYMIIHMTFLVSAFAMGYVVKLTRNVHNGPTTTQILGRRFALKQTGGLYCALQF